MKFLTLIILVRPIGRHPLAQIYWSKIINNETKLSVTGLGYVGLPIALAFAGKIYVIGFDIKENRIE